MEISRMLPVQTMPPSVERQSSADAATAMSVAVLHDFPPPPLESAWRKLLCAVPLPSHYTSPEYFLEPYFEGKRPFAILVLRGNAAAGVLTGFHEGDEVACGLPTRPQIQIDPAADKAAVLAALALGLEREAQGAKLLSIYSWEWLPLDPLLDLGYRRRELVGNAVLDLSMGADKLLRQCDNRRRNRIRYGIRHGVEVSPAESREDYETFYRIYAQWCAAKRTHCYSFETEDLAYRTTGRNRLLLLARHEGKIIAGNVFRFFPNGLIECSRNSSLPEYQSLRPNDMLVWRGVEWGCEQGFPLMSMGSSHRFLREFGGPIVPIIRYRIDRTLLRRHDRREQFVDAGRRCVAKLPPAWENRIRRWIGKEIPSGW